MCVACVTQIRIRFPTVCPVDPVDLSTLSTCRPINQSTLSTCRPCQPVDLSTSLPCRPVDSVDLSTLSTLSTCRLCRPVYPVNQGDIYVHSSHFMLSLHVNMSSHFKKIMYSMYSCLPYTYSFLNLYFKLNKLSAVIHSLKCYLPIRTTLVLFCT